MGNHRRRIDAAPLSADLETRLALVADMLDEATHELTELLDEIRKAEDAAHEPQRPDR